MCGVGGGVRGVVSRGKGGGRDGLPLELMFRMKDGGVRITRILGKGRTPVESVVTCHVSW